VTYCNVLQDYSLTLASGEVLTFHREEPTPNSAFTFTCVEHVKDKECGMVGFALANKKNGGAMICYTQSDGDGGIAYAEPEVKHKNGEKAEAMLKRKYFVKTSDVGIVNGLEMEGSLLRNTQGQRWVCAGGKHRRVKDFHLYLVKDREARAADVTLIHVPVDL
jgi:hypothetical protein